MDKGQRQLVTAEMAHDILRVYQLLGGVVFLHEWASANPGAFINGPLARLMPAPPKEDPDVQLNQVNIGSMGDTEAAMRIAFVLAKGVHAQGETLEAERLPYSQQEAKRLPYSQMTPQGACRMPEPEPDPEREAFFAKEQLSPDERLNAETLDEHVNRRAFAQQGRATRPAWMPSKDDLL